jgi:HlyD family secretion protein
MKGPSLSKDMAELNRRWSARGYIRAGVLTLATLVFGFGAWAAFASISGAVVAPGRLKVEGNRQIVQHLEGGVVARILVKEGDVADAGQVLIRLDDTQLRAELGIVESRLFDTLARIARLEAEQEDAAEPRFDKDLLAEAAVRPDVAALVEGQRRLFKARLETMQRESEQLRERQAQIRDEIEGSVAQMKALDIQIGFINRELVDQRSLLERGLTQTSRVLSLERENARLQGESGSLKAQVAQARGRITEIEIQLVGREATRREEAMTDLRDLKATEAELRERRLSTRDKLSRLDIRAPRGGIVLGMTVFTEGAVIRPAETVMYIVPTDEALVVESRIEVTNIDQVYPGQEARLHFSAFKSRTTPQVQGVVKRISPDALTDERTGASYYTAEVAIGDEGLHKLDGLTLVAGMPVEAFIQTGERSPLSYLTEPFTEFFSRSMLEQ